MDTTHLQLYLKQNFKSEKLLIRKNLVNWLVQSLSETISLSKQDADVYIIWIDHFDLTYIFQILCFFIAVIFARGYSWIKNFNLQFFSLDASNFNSNISKILKMVTIIINVYYYYFAWAILQIFLPTKIQIYFKHYST